MVIPKPAIRRFGSRSRNIVQNPPLGLFRSAGILLALSTLPVHISTIVYGVAQGWAWHLAMLQFPDAESNQASGGAPRAWRAGGLVHSRCGVFESKGSLYSSWSPVGPDSLLTLISSPLVALSVIK